MSDRLQIESGLPIVRYQHPERAGDVALVGMVHWLPDPTPYDEAYQYIAARQDAGSTIHYELILSAEEDELEQVDRLTKLKYDALQRRERAARHIADLLELTHQTDHQGFRYHGNDNMDTRGWENHDLTALEIVQRLPSQCLTERARRMTEVLSLVRGLRPDQRKGLREFILEEGTLDDPVPDDPHAAVYEKVIVGDRNEVALQAVERALQDNADASFTLIWGLAHLPGIGIGLEKRGYNRVVDN